MNMLITQKDEKNLRKLLTLAISPELTMSYDELRGFLHGIAITPDSIDPSEWVPVIFGDEKPDYESDGQIRDLLGTLFTVLNKHIAAFQADNLFAPFDFSASQETEVHRILEWTSGLEEALALRPECWEEHEELTEEEQDQLMNSLVVIEGIVYPEEAMDMFTHLSSEELEQMDLDISGKKVDDIVQVQLFMLAALEQAIDTLQAHGARSEKRRRDMLRSSAMPFAVPTSAIEKKKKCPCYSGQLFGECCGQSGETDREGASRGKLIKVDFSKKIRTKEKSRRRTTMHRQGQSYQLEISLASTQPLIWRRIEVPGRMTLADLHHIIQVAMGWKNRHLHQFRSGRKTYGPQLADDYTGTPVLDESRFHLGDLEHEFLQGLVYTYDFGDNWEHVILLEKALPPSVSRGYPQVIDGERACPPEDIGGVFEFEAYLDYLNGSKEQHLVERFGEMVPYDPEHFDAGIVNKLLKIRYHEK